MIQFWMVWRVGDRGPTMQHATYAAAIEEARRLAGLNDGEFVVLSAVATAHRSTPPVAIEFIQAPISGY